MRKARSVPRNCMDSGRPQHPTADVCSLENEFDEAMMNVYRAAKEECDYNATYFLNMLFDHGGVETAHRLLASPAPQAGFKRLWQCGRLDLTVECLVLDKRFGSLFKESELEEARRRLRKLDYNPHGCE